MNFYRSTTRLERIDEDSFHIYCQIPFCVYRCPHCCFVSMFEQSDLTNLSLIPEYVKSLVHEINHFNFPQQALQSIVFGGGTPALLKGSQVGMIVKTILKRVSKINSDHFCMSYETTPELATKRKLKDFRLIGFTRVSIGVQSFIDEDLKLLSRVNKSRDAFAAIDNARNAGYDAVSIDLLGGFPGSSFDKWVSNLETATNLNTECICINMMVYNYDGAKEYISAMERQGYRVPSFDERVKIYEYALSHLKGHGYEKVSYNLFCKPGSHYLYEISAVGQADKSVYAFGPWVVSHLEKRVYQSYPFIREYIRQPFFKTMSCSYKENVDQLIYGQLICHGAVLRNVVEPLIGCSLEEAIYNSQNARNLVIELIARGFAIVDHIGLTFQEDKLAAGLIYLWGYQGKMSTI